MKIKTMYVIHHSHTDIGYTDLQERVVYSQVNHIRNAVNITKNINPDFRWNCETWYCVLEFLKRATEAEKNDFFELVRKGKIGISANYLNFNDLADIKALDKRTGEMVELLNANGFTPRAAMIADINGVSMGQRDIYIKHGIEFFYTNIHCHHGMYPLFQNQKPYYWANDKGEKLLVWSGEHYNLGNALGIVPNKSANYMMQNYFGDGQSLTDAVGVLKDNLARYINEVETAGYDYDFILSSVSGVFSDNAPPNPVIINMINSYNNIRQNGVELKMATLDEVYHLIKDKVKDAPVYSGDLNDWWANGVGSTPYQVKHYREAQRMRSLCDILDNDAKIYNKELIKTCEDNLLLYAEHTWGHSSTETDPYTTMVQNLDIRKTSYASKAHEAAAMRLNEITHKLGDTLSYYNTSGKIKAVSSSPYKELRPVEFYVETLSLPGIVVKDKNGKTLTAQLAKHPRGVLVSFVDEFEPFETKVYTYSEFESNSKPMNTRVAYIGAERVRDIINDYDKLSYTLSYGIENDYMKISWKIGEGITSFYDKKAKKELMLDGLNKFFTPVYEKTEIRTDVYEERRKIGRNVKGLHATHSQGVLRDVKILEQGEVFTLVQLEFKMDGTEYCAVLLKLYSDLPRVDFTLRTAKTISDALESVYLPLCLNTGDKETFIQKGGVIFRPGVDQLPGTCMEYNMTDGGVCYIGNKNSILIDCKDTPLVYMGVIEHHPIKLCDNNTENNKKPVLSWIMNNTWETNFKMDLSGYGEFCYSVILSDKTDKNECFRQINGIDIGGCAFIIE